MFCLNNLNLSTSSVLFFTVVMALNDELFYRTKGENLKPIQYIHLFEDWISLSIMAKKMFKLLWIQPVEPLAYHASTIVTVAIKWNCSSETNSTMLRVDWSAWRPITSNVLYNPTGLVTFYLSNETWKSQPRHVDLCVQCRPIAHIYILAMSWAGVHKMCVHCTHNMKSSACACVHVCTMELVCVRHTHTVLCVCAFLSVVANGCRLLKMGPKCQPFWANCMYTPVYSCLSKTQYFDVVFGRFL